MPISVNPSGFEMPVKIEDKEEAKKEIKKEKEKVAWENEKREYILYSLFS